MPESITPDYVYLVGTLKARPGKVGDLITAVKSIVPGVRTEPGCISYAAFVDRTDPNTVVMLETWDSAAALETHASAPAFSGLAATFDELLSEPPVLVTLQQLA
ncbi:putative quinol monooxygenase [Paenirhodobacter populi]|uniref:Antibiotic biosynthesis monooxygenase n=1 Tax=Paenirhodobacter populi TaxID=2306993 RepID=A0A443JR86_9RHOB|nr:putative quinol monooxygenase [Sinirhodobacter populi]RWR23016.1 antibiotic biosynthesis monooxygenase [Sinirhodobacter populi]